MLPAIAVVLGLLVAAAVFARVASNAGLPAPAAFVLCGIAANGMLPSDLQLALTPATLALFLPALIFEGAWNLDVEAVRRAGRAIVVLAVPGVLVTATAIALAGFTAGGLAFPAALALGAMLSATDPVAVLALFRTLHLPPALVTIVEGESIANDGVAVVLFQIALLLGIPNGHGFVSVFGAVVYSPLAGIVIGVVVAKFLEWVLRRYPHPVAGIVVTLAAAYGSYALATLADASGIFASAAVGIVLPQLSLEASEVSVIDRFWEGAAALANAIVFLLVGLSLQFDRLFHEPVLLVATIAAVVLSRVVLAYVLVPVGAIAGAFANGWRRAIALAGIRGGLSLALALGLPANFPNRPAVIDAVFAVVFATLVPVGWVLAPLLRRCKLAPKTVASR